MLPIDPPRVAGQPTTVRHSRPGHWTLRSWSLPAETKNDIQESQTNKQNTLHNLYSCDYSTVRNLASAHRCDDLVENHLGGDVGRRLADSVDPQDGGQVAGNAVSGGLWMRSERSGSKITYEIHD